MRGRPDEHGIALLMVISALAILSLLGVALAGQARTQARLARNLAETEHARAIAESGVSLAVFHLIGADWLPDRAVHAVAYDNGTVRITIEDESGKVDLVQGPDAIIANLLDRLAIGGSERAALLGAIDDRRRASAKARAASFDALEALVPSDARALAERLQPYATVYTHSSQIDPMTAPPLVLAAVPGMDETAVAQLLAARSDMHGQNLPPIPAAALPYFARNDAQIVRIHAESITDAGATAAIEAVAAPTGDSFHPYRFLLWRGGWARTDEAEAVR